MTLAGQTTTNLPPPQWLAVEHSLVIYQGHDHWAFEVMQPKPKYADKLDYDRYGDIRKNGRRVVRFKLETGPFLEVAKVRIHPGYPVVAFRSNFGLGVHWDTIFFAILNGRLEEMGRPPAMNSRGPALWHGRRNIWMFDNFDRYVARDDPSYRPAIVLMKVGHDGRLRRWRTIWTRHPGVPETVPDMG